MQALAAGLGLFWVGSWMADKYETYKMMSEHRSVRSTTDGEMYYVVKGGPEQEVANLLARVRNVAYDIIMHTRNMLKDTTLSNANRIAIQNLVRRHGRRDSIKVHELDAHSNKAIAYNIDKGQAIFLCCRDEYGKVSRDELVLYVLLHEIAHSMIDEFDENANGFTLHSPLFKRNEAFLYSIAHSMRLLSPSMIPGQTHCGIILPDPNVAT